MNILIVSHGIPSKEDPQWGCLELGQAKALSRLGHHVTMAAVDGRFRRWVRLPGIHSVQIEGIDTFLYYLFPFKVLHYPVLKRKVRTWLMTSLFEYVCRKKGTPDVIYAHYMFSIGALEGVKKKHPNLPVVGVEHWSVLSRTELGSATRTRGKIAYKLADRLLAVSSVLQEQIGFHFGKRSDVVHDMVDDVFLNTPIKLEKSFVPFRFVSVASLNEGKGFDVLIEAFSGMDNKMSELIVIGDGPLRNSLAQLCKDLGVENRVFLKGRLSHDEIVDILSEAHSYVLASRSETFGVSYIEALAMGLPVIATRCGGPESFMNDICGIMVDVDDVSGLTNAMNMMVGRIQDYSPEVIRGYIRSRFSGEVIAKQLERIFEEEIEKKRQ